MTCQWGKDFARLSFGDLRLKYAQTALKISHKTAPSSRAHKCLTAMSVRHISKSAHLCDVAQTACKSKRYFHIRWAKKSPRLTRARPTNGSDCGSLRDHNLTLLVIRCLHRLYLTIEFQRYLGHAKQKRCLHLIHMPIHAKRAPQPDTNHPQPDVFDASQILERV